MSTNTPSSTIFIAQQQLYSKILIEKASLLFFPPTPPLLASTESFIAEILRCSSSTYAIFQLSLIYYIKIQNNEKVIQIYKKSKHFFKKPQNAIYSCCRRVWLGCLILATKMVNDKKSKNKEWARIAGMKVENVNEIERAVLVGLDYKCSVSLEVFLKWCRVLVNDAFSG